MSEQVGERQRGAAAHGRADCGRHERLGDQHSRDARRRQAKREPDAELLRPPGNGVCRDAGHAGHRHAQGEHAKHAEERGLHARVRDGITDEIVRRVHIGDRDAGIGGPHLLPDRRDERIHAAGVRDANRQIEVGHVPAVRGEVHHRRRRRLHCERSHVGDDADDLARDLVRLGLKPPADEAAIGPELSRDRL